MIFLILSLFFISFLRCAEVDVKHPLLKTGNEIPNKIWVYFRYKHIPRTPLNEEHFPHLTKEAIRRRQLSSETDFLFDSTDLPIPSFYLNRVVEILGGDETRIPVKSKWLNAISILNPSTEEIDELSTLPFVQSIEPVRSMKNPDPLPPPSKSQSRSLEYAGQWGASYPQLEQIGITHLQQDENLYGQNVSILVIDSGFKLTHRCFQNISVTHTWDFVRNDTDVGPQSGDPPNQWHHGTEVLSILAGYDPTRFMGSSPLADFILAKTEDLSKELPSEEDNFLAAVEWGEALGAQIVTSSLGYSDWYEEKDYDGQTSVATRAMDLAVKKGMVAITSAGNRGTMGSLSITVPTDSYFIVSVGAVSYEGDLAPFSSQGPTIDNRIKPEVCALGFATFMVSCFSDVDYRAGSGTSFAAPVAAGAIALIKQKYPSWGPRKIRNLLMQTSSMSSQPDNRFGWGIMNATAAMQYSKDCQSNDCKATESIPNGYIYSCFNTLGGCSPGDGKWICKKGYSGISCDEKYVCNVPVNCAFKCVSNVCVRYSGFVDVAFDFVWGILSIIFLLVM